MWNKIKTVLSWIGAIIVGGVAIGLGGKLLSDNRGGAERVREHLDDAGEQNQRATEAIDRAKSNNRDTGELNQRARTIIDRVRARGDGTVNQDRCD